MTYGDFSDLSRRSASDKVLRDKAFIIAKNPKDDGYQSRLSSMVYILSDGYQSRLSSMVYILSDLKSLLLHQPLADEVQKSVIRKVFIRVLGADLADM